MIYDTEVIVRSVITMAKAVPTRKVEVHTYERRVPVKYNTQGNKKKK
jgi:hypothetical protein